MSARAGIAVRAGQRGVALIMAVLIVALATMLAVGVVYRGVLDQRRTGTLLAMDQAFQIALGAEAWAADFLQRDLQQSQGDNLSETWAQPLPPLPVDGGTVAGRLVDLQGRFNLNNLVFADGTPNPDAIEQFSRILVALDLETSWASIMADWIDLDTQPGFPDGAEDNVYLGQVPPYLAANMPVTRASEIMALPGFGPDRWARLKPYVTALPVGTKLNVCTAPGIVLDALSDGLREFGLNPDDLAKRRANGCFPSLNDLRGAMGDEAYNKVKDGLSESSSYFGATVWVTIGTTDFTLYSLLVRGQGGLVRPQLRSFGTE
ncbi:MAG: type II secretion system minor pseudopilin GspK [Candidatus Binatia bacterium]